MSGPSENPYLPPASLPPEPTAPVERVTRPVGSLIDIRLVGSIAAALIVLSAGIRVVNDGIVYLITTSILTRTEGLLTFLQYTHIATRLVAIVAVIFYCRWIFLAAKNALTVQGGFLKTAPGLSVLCYFIPIYCFFGPFISMREIIQISYRDSTRASIAPLVLPWWICFSLNRYVLSIVAKHAMSPLVSYAGTLSWLGAAVFISIIIARLSQTQAEIALPEAASPPPSSKPSAPAISSMY